MTTFDDARLRKRIAWLNNAGGFENQIIYSKVAETAEGLTDQKVMEILKYLEDNYDKVWDPMRWICSSIEKAKSASEGLESELDQALRRRVRWLNNEGGFENKILYSKIAEAAVGLDARRVMEVLKYLEERWEWVDDPTAWVCAGLRKASSGSGEGGGFYSDGYGYGRGEGGKGSYGGYGGGGYGGNHGSQGGYGAYGSGYGGNDGSYDDFYDKLWRRVLWLNSKGGFADSIQYPKVADCADGVDHGRVFELLSYLEENWQKVGDPTAWLCSSLLKARQGPQGASDFDDTKDRKLRQRVRWLNNEGGFANCIIYDKVAEASSGIETSQVLEILKHLEDSWERVGDPTAWVCSSLRKAGSGGQQDYDFDRKLRARVRWLNSEGGFENRINYSKISQASVGLSSDKVFKALQYLEEKGIDQVEDPTSWVCAGINKARRAGGGGDADYAEAKPPVRPRKGQGKGKDA